MPSTILSSLGEPILHSNSLATITDNWIVVRSAQSQSQVVVLIDSITAVKILKITHLHQALCGIGCLLIAGATLYSKEGDGATMPFTLVGASLFTGAQFGRRAAIALVVDSEVIQTAYGRLRDVATIVVALRSVREGTKRDRHPALQAFSWLLAYAALLV
jgi:hypothetical protein